MVVEEKKHTEDLLVPWDIYKVYIPVRDPSGKDKEDGWTSRLIGRKASKIPPTLFKDGI